MHQFEKGNDIPIIDNKFIMMIMKTISKSDNKRGQCKNDSLILKIKLDNFYEKYYKPLTIKSDQLTYTDLTQLLDYESISIVTCISNHIMNNFENLLNRYINIVCDKKSYELKIKNNSAIEQKDKESLKNKNNYKLKQLKNDILFHVNNADDKYIDIKKNIRENILKVNILDDKLKSINYDICKNPSLYLESLI
jgi:hypothetical protein